MRLEVDFWEKKCNVQDGGGGWINELKKLRNLIIHLVSQPPTVLCIHTPPENSAYV